MAIAMKASFRIISAMDVEFIFSQLERDRKEFGEMEIYHRSDHLSLDHNPDPKRDQTAAQLDKY